MLEKKDLEPTLICGDSLEVMRDFPAESIDMVVTSPPYWMKREYLAGGIGLEEDWQDYIDNLVAICAEVYRVLKPTGSFWLNIGDSYHDKDLLLIPQRVAICLTDEASHQLPGRGFRGIAQAAGALAAAGAPGTREGGPSRRTGAAGGLGLQAAKA